MSGGGDTAAGLAGRRQTQNAVAALEYVDLPNGSAIARELIADNLLETRCMLHPQEGSAVPVQPIDFRGTRIQGRTQARYLSRAKIDSRDPLEKGT